MNLTKTLLATCLLAATTLPLTLMAEEADALPQDAAATTGAGWYAVDQWARNNIYAGGTSIMLGAVSAYTPPGTFKNLAVTGAVVTSPNYYNWAGNRGGNVYDWTHR
jgi:hypothetical protein